MKFVGVDGCKGGWFAVWVNDGQWAFDLYARFEELWAVHSDAVCVLVDMPIGLAKDCVRKADSETRKMLAGRAGSLFNTPVRSAVHAESKAEAKSINQALVGKSLTEQSLGIMQKVKAVDLFITETPEAVDVVRESHPELNFNMAAGRAMEYAKRDVLGVVERLEILERIMPDVRGLIAEVRERYPMSKVAGDDILDACILAVTGLKSGGQLTPIPNPPEIDENGLPMAVWYCEDRV